MTHPNAFFVPRPEGGQPITFDAFLQHFPFSADAFHFRFQVQPSHPSSPQSVRTRDAVCALSPRLGPSGATVNRETTGPCTAFAASGPTRDFPTSTADAETTLTHFVLS